MRPSAPAAIEPRPVMELHVAPHPRWPRLPAAQADGRARERGDNEAYRPQARLDRRDRRHDRLLHRARAADDSITVIAVGVARNSASWPDRNSLSGCFDNPSFNIHGRYRSIGWRVDPDDTWLEGLRHRVRRRRLFATLRAPAGIASLSRTVASGAGRFDGALSAAASGSVDCASRSYSHPWPSSSQQSPRSARERHASRSAGSFRGAEPERPGSWFLNLLLQRCSAWFRRPRPR